MTKQVKLLIIVFIGVVGIVALGSYLLSKSSPDVAVDQGKLVSADSHQTNSGAKVTVVEFGDYQCPACGAAYPIVKGITDQYAANKDFNFVFRNLPLPMHANAPMAAEAAEAAGSQSKYWEMHDKLYQTQNEWADSSNPLDQFVTYAEQLGLDAAKFKQEVLANKYSNVIAADQADANALGLNSTPTFFVNGQKFVGVPGSDFASKIQAELAK